MSIFTVEEEDSDSSMNSLWWRQSTTLCSISLRQLYIVYIFNIFNKQIRPQSIVSLWVLNVYRKLIKEMYKFSSRSWSMPLRCTLEVKTSFLLLGANTFRCLATECTGPWHMASVDSLNNLNASRLSHSILIHLSAWSWLPKTKH